MSFYAFDREKLKYVSQILSNLFHQKWCSKFFIIFQLILLMRPSKRKTNETRNISFNANTNSYAEGSCIVNFGNTKLICTATHENKVPRFLKHQNQGWLTAEYGMLPRSTHSRMNRESSLGKQSGRTLEIQRLIGRSLRSAIDLKKLGESQIIIDCDVIQADGGTRTAAISGGYVALALCIKKLLNTKKISQNPLKSNIAAISCGIWQDNAIVDLDYIEDSNIDVDANFVFNQKEEIIEIQGSAEGNTFSKQHLLEMYELASDACNHIFKLQENFIQSHK